MAGKPVKTIIEGVRDGTTVRAFIPIDDSHVHITMLLSGVRVRAIFVGRHGRVDPVSREVCRWACMLHILTYCKLGRYFVSETRFCHELFKIWFNLFSLDVRFHFVMYSPK